MPSAAARRLYEDQIPPFMTVFDLDAETITDQDTVTVLEPKYLDMDGSGAHALSKHVTAQPLRSSTMTADSMHKHHDSTSTQASESAESSPTTTLSTTDSSPLSDPSPSSSPDSPINLVPLSSFPATSFGALSNSTLSIPETSAIAPSGRPMTSPAPRRPKNMKGLSIQPPCLSAPRPITANNMNSEPASPSFIKPTIPAMKRKPSQLSLKTNSSDLLTRTLEVPSTPAMPPPMPPILQRRALKHSTSSPHMLSSLKSATFGPAGGMSFPEVHERNESGLSELLRPSKISIGAIPYNPPITEEDSPIRTQIANRAGMDGNLVDESEQNEDQKSPGYPNGPIAIYDDDVYLYLEPSAEEAARFDTVINVAREVKNPFEKLAVPVNPAASQRNLTDSPIPDTAVTDASFTTAFEFQPTPIDDRSVETPTTPKASAFPPNQPEYIHMLWDHNTDIAPDLMNLCETIHARTKEGKKVLIHCQQGASRSASLIIAYGLFRNPELNVNDAYYAAQSKSKWISPNMKLMYCLQDFQKEMAKRKTSPGSAFRPRSGRSPTKHRLTLSADAIEISPKEPRTAPLPDENEDSRSPSSEARDSPARARGYSTPNMNPVTPGPSSAPSTFWWTEIQGQADQGKPAYFDLSLPQVPPVPPVPEIRQPPVPSLSISSIGSPKAETFAESFFFKPPPSPGFGAHRFGPGPSTIGGFGFASLNLGGSTPSPEPQPLPSHGFDFGFAPIKVAPAPTRAPPPAPVPEIVERKITIIGAYPEDEALMSPRAEAMTNNPLHDPQPEVAGMHFAESPPTPTEGLFSPREGSFPRDPFGFGFGRPSPIADPRSPPTKGEAPIVRSIDDMI